MNFSNVWKLLALFFPVVVFGGEPLVVRTYQGAIAASAAGIVQGAEVTVEIAGTAAAFANPAGASFLVRGRIEGGSPLAETVKGKWSNRLRAIVTNEPFRADVVWADGRGRVGLSRASDWSTITAAAAGEVVGIPIELSEAMLALVSVSNEVEAVKPDAGGALFGGPWSREQWEKFELVGKKNRFDPLAMQCDNKMRSAEMPGDHVRMSFEPLGYPQRSGSKTTDGGCAIFWEEDGHPVGGIFDWHGVGQTYKTMENIPGGYMDGRQPPKGARVWFGIVAYGYQRWTGLVESRNRWHE